MKHKKYIQTIVGFIFSVLGLIWVFSGIDYTDINNLLNKIDLKFILLSLIVLFIAIFFRATIFSLLSKHKYDLKTSFLYKNQLIGYFANNILPFRTGELVRVYILNKNLRVNDSKFFIFIILIERIIDLIILGFLFLIILPFFSIPQFIYDWGLLSLSNLILFLIFISAFISAMIYGFPKSFKPLKKKFIDNIFIFDKKTILLALFHSFFVWLSFLLYTFFIQQSLHLELSIFDCLVILVLSALVQIVPSAPGSIGTYHAAVKYICVSFFHISDFNAVSLAIILHFISYISFSIVGAIIFIKNNYSLMLKKYNSDIFLND